MIAEIQGPIDKLFHTISARYFQLKRFRSPLMPKARQNKINPPR